MISTGEIEQFVDLLPKMVKIHPWDSDVHSHMLFNLRHLPDVDPQMIFDEHKRWAEIHAPVNRMEVVHDNVADPDRPLRIGYISPVMSLWAEVLKANDKSRLVLRFEKGDN